VVDAKLKKDHEDKQFWEIKSETNEIVFGRITINCTGNYGDLIEKIAHGNCNFTIKPRKGQFIIYDKPASLFVNSIILPVPNKITKGILITQTVNGNLIVGPTAEDQFQRSILLLEKVFNIFCY
jgi:glycerol-3-phosphate dehydrogenase